MAAKIKLQFTPELWSIRKNDYVTKYNKVKFNNYKSRKAYSDKQELITTQNNNNFVNYFKREPKQNLENSGEGSGENERISKFTEQ